MRLNVKPAAAVVVAALVGWAPAASAATFWAGNGHYYDYVAAHVNWDTALADAAAAAPMAGYAAHLVTIADAGEDNFVRSLTGNAQFVWAAGTNGGVPGQWKWAAGPQAGQVFYGPGATPGSYSAWNPGEPNNADGNQEALQLHSFGNDWNDINNGFIGNGYVVEYSPIQAPPQLYAGNGHLYQFVQENGSWDLALSLAAHAAPIAGYDSYLATITDAGEDAFIKSLIGGAQFVWAAGAESGGAWRWAAGPEAGQIFYGPGAPAGSYSHWNPGEPNGVDGPNEVLQLNGFGDHWNDTNGGFSPSGGYVVEYSPHAVPEPSNWALMLLGFGGLGAALRRRRVALVATG